MSIIPLLKSIENKCGAYRGKDSVKKFSEPLREDAMKIINFKKKKINSLIKEEQESYENAKICYICKEKIKNKYVNNKKYCRIKGHCEYTEEYREVLQISYLV